MFDVRARIQMYPIRTSNKALEPSPAGLPTGERVISSEEAPGIVPRACQSTRLYSGCSFLP
jgi:hypothetical protein